MDILEMNLLLIYLTLICINTGFGTNGVIVNSVIPGIKLKVNSGREDRSVYPDNLSLVGGRAELPCNVTPSSADDQITLILWYKEGNSTPIYSVDARDSALSKAKHLSTADLFGANRALFDTTRRPALLKIEPIRHEDDHQYRCRVDFRYGRTMSSFVRLHVIVPPRKMLIRDDMGRPVHHVIGPYDEGSPLRLFCEAEGGKPPPAIHWYREEQLVDDSFTATNDNTTIINDLFISNLSRNDLNVELYCRAVNPNFTSNISTSVRLDLNLKPLDVKINALESPLSAGNSVEVICTTAGSRPTATIAWFRDNHPINHSSERTSNVGNVTISAITYKPSAEDDGLYLWCRADNPRLNSSSIETGIRLNISYSPRVSLILGTKSGQHIKEGDEVFMKCQIKANPDVIVIQFFVNGTQINDQIEGISVNNSTLVIKSVRRRHSGRYQCSANNSEGRGDSNHLFVNTSYAPVCMSQKAVFGAALGDKVVIKCTVDAEPADVAFQWTVNNNELLGSHASFGLSSTLAFVLKTKRDYGVVSCRAKNTIGVQSDPCVFSIVAAGTPQPVNGCLVVNQTSTSILIDCISGDDGGLAQTFHLELYEWITGRMMANVSEKSRPEFTLSGLLSGTQYAAYVYSSNGKGRSPTVHLTVPTLASLNRKYVADSPPKEDMSALVVVCIGLFSVTILLAMIVFVICKIRTANRLKERLQRGHRHEPHDNCCRLYASSSKQDLTEITNSSDFKNPDVIPPIDGYGFGSLERISTEPSSHQMNSKCYNRQITSSTLNAQNLKDENIIYQDSDPVLRITLTPEPVINFINVNNCDIKTSSLQRQRVFPLSTPV